jgi:NAD-dependent SIR2 family protein deacetylase
MAALRRTLVFGFFLMASVGCGGSADSTRLSSSQQDEYNERVDEINRAWEDFRVAGNACTAEDADCFSAALESSGFVEAVGNLRTAIVRFGESVDPGECKSALEDAEASLHTLLITLDILKYGDASDIPTAAPQVRSAWDAAVESVGPSAEVCV